MFLQARGFPFPQRRIEPLYADGSAATATGQALPALLTSFVLRTNNAPLNALTPSTDTGLTAQGSAAIIDLTRDSPCANDSTLQRKSVDTKRDAKVEDSMTLAGSKRARGESARTTVVAALGMVDQETVRIGGMQQKQLTVKTVGLLHAKSRHQIGSDAAQPLARSFMVHPLGMQPPVPSMEIGVDTTQLLPSTRRSLATHLKWPESQVTPSRQCIPCLAARQRLYP